MVVLDVVIKTLREVSRSRGNVLILLLGPVIFFSFFGFIFQPTDVGISYREIGIINNDAGYSEDPIAILPAELLDFDNKANMGELYSEVMSEQQDLLIDSDIVVRLVTYQQRETMLRDIETRNIELGVVIGVNFSRALVGGYMNITGQSYGTTKTTVSIYADPSLAGYLTNLGMVEESLSAFETMIYGPDRMYGQPVNGGNLEIRTEYRETEDLTDFQYMVSGFLVFNALLQMITASTYIAKEKEQKTINRIKMSHLQPWELLAGVTLSQLLIFLIQFVISIFVLTFWGIGLTMLQWLRIFFILILVTIILTGISLVVASLVKTADDASTITGIGSAPLGFLSGSFLPVPEIFLIRSINLQFWDLIPTYHATQAVFEIIVNDATYVGITKYLVAMVLYSILIYVLGIIVFNKKVIKGTLT